MITRQNGTQWKAVAESDLFEKGKGAGLLQCLTLNFTSKARVTASVKLLNVNVDVFRYTLFNFNHNMIYRTPIVRKFNSSTI